MTITIVIITVFGATAEAAEQYEPDEGPVASLVEAAGSWLYKAAHKENPGISGSGFWNPRSLDLLLSGVHPLISMEVKGSHLPES